MCEIFSYSTSSLLQKSEITPGSIHGNRVSILNPNVVLFASNNSIYRFNVTYPDPSKVHFKASKHPAIPFPASLENVTCSKIHTSPNSFEIMQLANETNTRRIAAVDAVGNVSIYKHSAELLEQDMNRTTASELRDGEEEGEATTSKKRRIEKQEGEEEFKKVIQVSHEIYDKKAVEKGWCGVSLHNTDESKFAIARFAEKDVYLFQGDKIEQRMTCSHFPTSVHYMDFKGTPLLAVAEYSALSIWDTRTSLNSPAKRVALLNRGRGCIYDIASNNTNGETEIGYAGAERTLFVVDSKKWTTRHRWQNALKYSISHISFSSTQQGLCYVAGLDNQELKCGEYVAQSTKLKHGIYANSRWLGVSCSKVSDTIAGVSLQGTLYVIKKPYNMYLMPGGDNNFADDDA